jgi:hypothetical protein
VPCGALATALVSVRAGGGSARAGACRAPAFRRPGCGFSSRAGRLPLPGFRPVLVLFLILVMPAYTGVLRETHTIMKGAAAARRVATPPATCFIKRRSGPRMGGDDAELGRAGLGGLPDGGVSVTNLEWCARQADLGGAGRLGSVA